MPTPLSRWAAAISAILKRRLTSPRDVGVLKTAQDILFASVGQILNQTM